ncbi:MAG TPA: cupin domain-containing protein [Bryobacteraceae bacterium]|jgi:mannose-6-phosphate isomerase-like protein (cupin superfamily)
MRALLIGFTVTVLTAALVAQQPPAAQAMKTFTSSSEITAMIAKAKADRKDQPLISQRILGLAPYQASLEYRASVGTAAVHEKEAEFFYVIDGAGTLTTGGKLTGETRNGDNLTGKGVEGGKQQQVSKGDFIVVPENTPHWFSKIDQTLVLMSLHVPRPVPAAK